jgi:hypothetical protein
MLWLLLTARALVVQVAVEVEAPAVSATAEQPGMLAAVTLSIKFTVPFPAALALFTVAVSVTCCPKTALVGEAVIVVVVAVSTTCVSGDEVEVAKNVLPLLIPE